jgi:hypothetical protein
MEPSCPTTAPDTARVKQCAERAGQVVVVAKEFLGDALRRDPVRTEDGLAGSRIGSRRRGIGGRKYMGRVVDPTMGPGAHGAGSWGSRKRSKKQRVLVTRRPPLNP